MDLYYDEITSPIGPLTLAATSKGLARVHFGSCQLPGAERNPARLRAVARQLNQYFAGTLRDFEVDLDLAGTPFQIEVWNALCTVPYGATASYRDIAFRVRRPDAVRAVGAANGRNPVAIIVPCHRIIGSSGALTGYAGGLDKKKFLLELESGARRIDLS